MAILIEQTSEKEMKQDIYSDEENEFDLMDLLRKIIGIRKKIYKAAGIGLVIGFFVSRYCFFYSFFIGTFYNGNIGIEK